MEFEYVVTGQQLWNLVQEKSDVLVLPEANQTIIRPYGMAHPHRVYPEGFYRLVGYEIGGGTSNEGRGFVVASFNGKPLTPVELYTHGEVANKRHAKFISNNRVPLMSVCARRENGSTLCSVELWQVNPNYGWEVGACPLRIADGIDPDNVPTYLEHLVEAIQAAAEKSACYHCKGVHFMEHSEGYAHTRQSAPVRE